MFARNNYKQFKNDIMKKLFTVIAIGVLFTSCAEQAAKPVIEEKTEEIVQAPAVSSEATKKVIEHHLQAFGSGDIEAVLSDYTEESIVITPEATLKGLDQIKGLFTKIGSLFPAEGSDFSLDRMDVTNELGYIVWHATTPIVVIPLGTDTYVVKDNKIMIQTFAAKLEMVEQK